MARTSLTTGKATGNAFTYTTATFTPAANRLVLAFVMNLRTGAGVADVPDAQGNGLTWVQVSTISIPPDAGTGRRLTCFRAMGAGPAAGALTFTFTQQQELCAWSIFEYDGVDMSGSNGSGAAIQPKTGTATGATSLGIQLNPLGAATSTIAAGIILPINKTISTGASVAIHQQLFGATGDTGMLQTQDRPGSGQDVFWGWAGAQSAAGIALEIKAAAVVSPPAPAQPSFAEALAKRFEPILFFHPREKFFPSDAKRYIEHCALWKAQFPFDAKGSWGGAGQPFPRKAIIGKGKIAAIQGEPGTFLGSDLVNAAEEERFLELSGWKDATGAAQPDVTQTSSNTYSERDAIEKRYNNPDNNPDNAKLKDSRFWYHAEFFDNARLKQALQTVPAPDLVKVLDGLKNAALLNYYFFFPAHEEPLEAVCGNVEAKEFACYGGDWACLALLLERESPDGEFNPAFVGHSGRWAHDPGTGVLWPAQAADDGDAAKRVVMKVSPATEDEKTKHVEVLVAKGTHSLYRNAAPKLNSYPGDIRPEQCGRFDTPQPKPPGKPDALETFGVGVLTWLAKVVSGGLLHPLGALVGIIWAAAEGHYPKPGGLVITGSLVPDNSANDEVSIGGKVVRPKNVLVPDAGPDVEDWRSEQGKMIDGRRYDFLVDRATQPWWPSDTDEGSLYNGRWGPRVEDDPLGRRSGMRFPPFWKMFFLAFEKGKAAKVL